MSKVKAFINTHPMLQKIIQGYKYTRKGTFYFLFVGNIAHNVVMLSRDGTRPTEFFLGMMWQTCFSWIKCQMYSALSPIFIPRVLIKWACTEPNYVKREFEYGPYERIDTSGPLPHLILGSGYIYPDKGYFIPRIIEKIIG